MNYVFYECYILLNELYAFNLANTMDSLKTTKISIFYTG